MDINRLSGRNDQNVKYYFMFRKYRIINLLEGVVLYR